jgi:CBS domain-containing protein
MKVEERMTKSPYGVGVEDSLQDAAELMDKHELGCVVVRDEGGFLAGILTDRDVCIAAARERDALGKLQVSQHMSSRVTTCKADDTLERALELMRADRVRRIAVTDEAGNPLGLISLDDLVHARDTVGDSAIAETLAAVTPSRTYG